MEYGWRQNKDYVGEQPVDPPNEYITHIIYVVNTNCIILK